MTLPRARPTQRIALAPHHDFLITAQHQVLFRICAVIELFVLDARARAGIQAERTRAVLAPHAQQLRQPLERLATLITSALLRQNVASPPPSRRGLRRQLVIVRRLLWKARDGRERIRRIHRVQDLMQRRRLAHRRRRTKRHVACG